MNWRPHCLASSSQPVSLRNLEEKPLLPALKESPATQAHFLNCAQSPFRERAFAMTQRFFSSR